MTVSWVCHDGLLCGAPCSPFPLALVAASPSVNDLTLVTSSDSATSDGSRSSSVKSSLLLDDDSLVPRASRASVEEVASSSTRPS